MSDFFEAVRKYLLVYLPDQRCFSENTIRSYRQTLNLFISYLRDVRGIPVKKIQFSLIDRDLIIDFLDWLEKARNCCARTRNQRLMALRSFLDYAGKNDCAQVALYVRALEVPLKKSEEKIVDFLSEDELSALLRQPDLSKPKGIRDMVLLTLMYDTAARCDEILELRVRDLRLDDPKPTALFHGKGRKTRSVPITSRSTYHCQRYMPRFHPNANEDDYSNPNNSQD